VRKLAQKKESGSKAKKVDYTAREPAAPASPAARSQAIEWAKEALPPPSPTRIRVPSPAPKKAASPAPKRAASPKAPRSAAKFAMGSLVSVSSRSEPGQKPRPGGAGKVTAVAANGGAWEYDVAYVLGGKEAGLAQNMLSEHAESPKKRARQPTRKAAAAADEEGEKEPAARPKRSRR
jgi:hypothetical protein